ncbi:phage terminase small subunit P27 family [Pelagibacterium halotolerans]|uniref:phage terminase small subunit P27 family n=1 Tax=Pelagibacterium halotolerans TaxID=531813 RepID=UPI00384C3C5D
MKGAKAHLKAIEGGLSGLPPVPDTIPADMVDEWQAVVSEMVERKILATTGLGIVETYIIARWTVRECQKALAEHGPLTKTAHGMLKPNPAAAILNKSTESVARLGAELGLTPAARSKQGFQNGGGKGKDGAPPDLQV